MTRQRAIVQSQNLASAFGGWFAVALVLGSIAAFAAFRAPTDARSAAESQPLGQVARDDCKTAAWSLAFSPDDSRLAYATVGGELWIKHLGPRGSLRVGRASAGTLRSVAFSADGKTLAAGGESGAVRLWDVETADEQEPLQLDQNPVKVVAYSPDGEGLAVALSQPDDTTPRIVFWDPERGRRVLGLSNDFGAVKQLAFSPDGTLLAAAGSSGMTMLWQQADDKVRATLQAAEGGIGGVDALAFSPDSALLATAGMGGVRLWRTADGTEKSVLPGTAIHVYGLAFSPDGAMLAVAQDRGTILWGITRVERCGAIQPDGSAAHAVAFSHDGRYLATADKGKAVRIWELARVLKGL